MILQLRQHVGNLTDVRVEIHAGATYVNTIQGRLESLGANVVNPLEGLAIGQRLTWYTRERQAFDDQADRLIARLSDASHAMPISDRLNDTGTDLASAGLYSWWADSIGAKMLTTGLGHHVNPGLIYVGQAGATSKNGIPSKTTLESRLRQNHLGSNSGSSTLRRSLGSILAQSLRAEAIDEAALTDWMNTHLQVITVAVADPRLIGSLEQQVLDALNPPLNLQGVPESLIRNKLSNLRNKFTR